MLEPCMYRRVTINSLVELRGDSCVGGWESVRAVGLRWDAIVLVGVGVLFVLGASGFFLGFVSSGLDYMVLGILSVWLSNNLELIALGTVAASVLALAILLMRDGAGVISPGTADLIRRYLAALFR